MRKPLNTYGVYALLHRKADGAWPEQESVEQRPFLTMHRVARYQRFQELVHLFLKAALRIPRERAVMMQL